MLPRSWPPELGMVSGMGEDVAHATHRLDVIAAVIGIAQLLADFADVHIDAAVEGGKLAAEDGIHQVLAGHDASSFAQQDVQQIKSDGGQLDRLAILANDSSGRIKLNITDPHDFGDLSLDGSALFSGLGSTQDGTNAGHQFARIERLGKIVVRTDFQAYNSVHIFPAGRKQQDGNARSVPYSSQNVEAIHARQHYIEHD